MCLFNLCLKESTYSFDGINFFLGSIVTETLENEILIPIDTLKELDFYADFNYINFIKFSLIHHKLRA